MDWKNPTEINGKTLETTYQLKQWQRSWAEHNQVIPDAALVVVALAITIATQGVGGGLFSSMVSSVTGGTMVATTTGTLMASAGYTALFVQAGTSFLRTGDPIATAKEMCSEKSLRSLGISIASAGLCSQLGSALKIDMNPSLKEVLNPGTKPVFTDFLQSQALKGGVNATLNVAVGGEDPEQALLSAIRQVPLNAAAAYAAYTVGDLGFQGEMTETQQDAAHTVIGAALGSLQHPEKPLEGALIGGANALVASHANRLVLGSPAEIKEQAKLRLLDQGLPVTSENMKVAANDIVHLKTALPAILSAGATALITRDPGLVSTGILTSSNVTENNCIPSLTKSLMLEGYEAQEGQSEEFWQDEFEDPRDLYLQKVLEAAFPQEEPGRIQAVVESIKAIREQNPTLMRVVDNIIHGIGGGFYYTSYAGAALTGFALGGPVGAVGSMALVRSMEETPSAKSFNMGS